MHNKNVILFGFMAIYHKTGNWGLWSDYQMDITEVLNLFTGMNHHQNLKFDEIFHIMVYPELNKNEDDLINRYMSLKLWDFL